MTAFYNEIDPYAAQWLRNLIAAGHVAPGIVDERDIRDITPNDLRGFTQCHFFAGVAVWSYALRRAGWSDDRPAWTGSCPCQPFSNAGQKQGFADERHLWPHWNWLIQECRPPVIFGEQVASKNADPWVDLVQFNLEAMDYAFGCVPFPAASVGAPHIRDRNYWVAHSDHSESWQRREPAMFGRRAPNPEQIGLGRSVVRLDHHHHTRSQRHAWDGDDRSGWPRSLGSVTEAGLSCGLPDTQSGGRGEECSHAGGGGSRDSEEGFTAGHGGGGHSSGLANDDDDGRQPRREIRPVRTELHAQHGRATRIERPGPTNGFWRDVDWLLCRDGKWRPVRPESFPLVNGATARVGRLRAYGNAIVAEAATQFIASYLDVEASDVVDFDDCDLIG